MSADPSDYRPSAADRCLEALSVLGGEASTAEIRQCLASAGLVLGQRQLLAALSALARLDPAPVTPLGEGRFRRWRLAQDSPRAPHPSDRMPWERSRAIGRNARELREAAGRRQEDVAADAGFSPASLASYERGFIRITAGRAEVLARVLGTTVEALTAGAGT